MPLLSSFLSFGGRKVGPLGETAPLSSKSFSSGISAVMFIKSRILLIFPIVFLLLLSVALFLLLCRQLETKIVNLLLH